VHRVRAGDRRCDRAALRRIELSGEREATAPGSASARQPIEAGEAVAWELGEEHESGSDEGMTAIIVEGESLGV
jgi:hypothetical protein